GDNDRRGVALLINSNLASTAHSLPNHLIRLNAVAANLIINDLIILIISFYIPANTQVPDDLLQYASQNRHTIIMGDFNARHTDFGDIDSNPTGRSLIQTTTNLPLQRLYNTEPTFINARGASISDHIFVSEQLLPLVNPHSSIGTTVTSDHLPLTTQKPSTDK
ncbi:Exo endo phos 2 domain containing protein, partial [Asbolus verrucosus]